MPPLQGDITVASPAHDSRLRFHALSIACRHRVMPAEMCRWTIRRVRECPVLVYAVEVMPSSRHDRTFSLRGSDA